MPSLRHASPRCPRRGAQRSAGTVAIGRHRGMRLSCGRSRAAAAQLRWDGGKRRRTSSPGIGLSRHLCDYGHAYPAASAYGIGVRHAVPNSVPGFSDRWYCKEKSVMTAYTSLLFLGIPRPPSRRPGPPPRRLSPPVSGPGRAPPTAVRRHPRSDRYRFAHPKRPLPPTSPAETVRRRPRRRRRCRASSVAVLRVLPGFSGSSQVHPPRM